MKKRLCLLALAAMLGLVPVLSGAAQKPDTRTMKMTTSVAEAYDIVIPPRVDIPFGRAETPVTIRVSSLCLLTGHRLSVHAATDGIMKNAQGDRLRYAIYLGAQELDEIKNPLRFTEAGDQTLTLVIAKEQWNKAPAGAYQGKITFTVSVSD